MTINLKVPESAVTITVKEVPLSNYIKQKDKELDKEMDHRMEDLFENKLVYSREASDQNYNKYSMFFHILLLDEIIGYFICVAAQYEHSAWLNGFYIDKKYRSKGYGKEALDKLKELMKAKDYNRLALSVVHGNPAERLYRKNGFDKIISTSLLCEI